MTEENQFLLSITYSPNRIDEGPRYARRFSLKEYDREEVLTKVGQMLDEAEKIV